MLAVMSDPIQLSTDAAPADEASLAPLSCFICRKRKVKCSRQLPSCSLCDRLSLDCAYPTESQKPGPKKGSNLERRKRLHNDDAGREGSVVPPSNPQAEVSSELDFSWLFDPSLDWARLAMGTTTVPGQYPQAAYMPPPSTPANIPSQQEQHPLARVSKSLGMPLSECRML